MELYHFTNIENKESILANGIKAFSKYEIFSSIRKNVVYCWMKKEDNKIPVKNQICFKVSIDEGRCLIADMDYVSMAMMYKHGDTVKG